MTEQEPFSKTGLPSEVIGEQGLDIESMTDVYTRVWEDLEAAQPLFSSAWDSARLNSAFVQGNQWTSEEREAFYLQKRLPYVFDQISPKVNAILGVHTSRRVEASVVPTEPGDEPLAQVATRLVRWCEQINRFDSIENEVFADMIVKRLGATVVRWQLSDTLSGRPVVERIPVYQLMWDPTSTDVNLSDARWMARIQPMSRLDAIEQWPEHEEIIANAASLGIDNVLNNYDVMTPRQQEYAYAVDAIRDRARRGEIIIVEHFERIKHYTYIVSDEIATELTEYDDEGVAQSHLEGLITQYAEGGENLLDEDGNDKVRIIRLERTRLVYSVLIGGECVIREVTELPDFPWQVAFCYHDDGEYWSFVDQLIDPQRFANRMISELDNQIGRGNKNIMTVVEARLKRGFGIKDLNEEKSKVSPTIPVLSHDALNIVPNQAVQQELPTAISLAIDHMTDVVGGRNALGLQENAAESGAAVRARQEAAGMARMPVFTHVNEWRRRVTEMCLWYMRRYLAPGQQLRILGDEGKPEWIQASSEVLDSLANVRMDIVINEAIDTGTAKERQFVQLKELFQTIGSALPPDVAIMAMLEYSSLEQSTKDKIVAMLPMVQEYQAKQAEEAKMAKLQQSAQDSVLRKQFKDQIEQEMAVSAAQSLANPTLGGITSTP